MSDVFNQVKKHAQRTLALLGAEIGRREAELKKLLAEADRWRDAVGRAGAGGRGVSTLRRLGSGGGGSRVSWDALLEGLPKTFSVDDVMAKPEAQQKGRAQVYPALNRWLEAKKVKRIGKGQYEKATGSGRAGPAKAATKKRGGKRRRGPARKAK
jgi:hypothetical protein